MQLIPSTGQEMASGLGWPPDFTTEDLYRPNVNITLGTRYLARQRDYFQTNKNRYTTLAAYNAGPGNAEKWYNISGDDPDLFLEVVRFAETRSYIIYISEAMHIYQKIYGSGL